jgi:phage baseplate assembly protein W
MLPEFGCRVHELVFAADTPAVRQVAQLYVREALERWEPRIRVAAVRTRSVDQATLQVEVDYTLRSGEPRRMTAQAVAIGRAR